MTLPAMKSLHDANETNLKWVQTGNLETQLQVADGSSVASLAWAKRGGTLATGASADGSWTLKRVGFWRPRVTVRESGTDIDFASYVMNWSANGVIEIPSEGQVYSFRRSSMWKSEWVLSQGDQKILTIFPDFGWKKIGAEIEIERSVFSSVRNLSLMAIITWYVIILMTYDEAGSSAATITAISPATAAAG